MGGRNARKAKRAAALPDNMKPVRPGQEGGLFKPLKEKDLPSIHEAILQTLESIGMDKAIPSCIEACTTIGCTVDENGRLLFPRSVVKESLAKAGRDITLFGAISEQQELRFIYLIQSVVSTVNQRLMIFMILRGSVIHWSIFIFFKDRSFVETWKMCVKWISLPVMPR